MQGSHYMTSRKPGVISELDKASSHTEECSQRRNLEEKKYIEL
jgi:hypothetical protein